MTRRTLHIATIFLTILAAGFTSPLSASGAGPFVLEAGSDVIGQTCVHMTVYEDTLLDIARDNDLGYNEIIAANPDIDPWLPGADVEVVVPVHWVLPDGKRDGIVLNLAEMRLFRYFTADGVTMVETYPLGVGREGADTPLTEFSITEMVPFPNWYPPEAIRLEKPDLPEVVYSGPDNPLGEYKMRLGNTSYLMHGTNRPWGVGRRVSHGCIRLYPEDIYKLFYEVAPGDRVVTVYQPVKAGLSGGRLMVEVHEDYLGGADLVKAAFREVIRKGYAGKLDAGKLFNAAREKSGVPVDVTR